MELSITNTDKLYNELQYKYSQYILDNYISILKRNTNFYVTHYIVRCVCAQTMPLYVYEDHKRTMLHNTIVEKHLDYFEDVCKQYLLQDIISIVKLYLY